MITVFAFDHPAEHSSEMADNFMNPIVLRGTKQEIVDSLINLTGNVNEAIVFVTDTKQSAVAPLPALGEDIFAEMQLNMVDIANFDGSREAIYTPQAGE